VKANDNQIRRRELAKIHIAKKALGFDDALYRDMLWSIARVRSAAELDAHGRAAVLEHLEARGWRADKPKAPSSKNLGKEPLLRKIGALLADSRRPWVYAHSLARHMYRVDRVDWCRPHQLRGIIAALSKDAARHGRSYP